MIILDFWKVIKRNFWLLKELQQAIVGVLWRTYRKMGYKTIGVLEYFFEILPEEVYKYFFDTDLKSASRKIPTKLARTLMKYNIEEDIVAEEMTRRT
jgi:hypothetical protein